MLKKLMCLCLAILLALPMLTAGAESWNFGAVTANDPFAGSAAYILNPPKVPEEPNIEHEIINILMLGVDYGVLTKGRGKKDIKNCHTDSVIMIALDLTANKISLISLPRDTLTYVPGVHGVYKLNAAINCAPTFAEGITSAEATVSWLLGGIRPDHYVVLAPHLVELIGDKIGGLDIDVEMTYSGHSGRSYTKGFQHLDGVGIMDYARARRNATKNPKSDYGRTNRQRILLNALFEKVSQNTDLAYDILDTIVENFDKYFFSDMSVADMWEMLSLADQFSTGNIGNYELNGEMTMAMKFFNSNFIDPKVRSQAIREVYGVEVPDLKLNSHGYLNYLHKAGFTAVKALRVGGRVIDWAKSAGYNGSTLAKAIEARDELIEALSAVDDRLDNRATNKVEKTTGAFKQAILNLKNASGYPEKLSWSLVETDHWYEDPDINDYYEIDWS